MNSKEALERIIKSHHTAMAMLCEGRRDNKTEKAIEIIKQDLNKLEALTINVNVAQSLAKRYKQENDELKQALDKACLRLELYDTCPVYAELVEDLDCDNCNDNCKECWKKYFMKEVLKDEKGM